MIFIIQTTADDRYLQTYKTIGVRFIGIQMHVQMKKAALQRPSITTASLHVLRLALPVSQLL